MRVDRDCIAASASDLIANLFAGLRHAVDKCDACAVAGEAMRRCAANALRRALTRFVQQPEAK